MRENKRLQVRGRASRDPLAACSGRDVNKKIGYLLGSKLRSPFKWYIPIIPLGVGDQQAGGFYPNAGSLPRHWRGCEGVKVADNV